MAIRTFLPGTVIFREGEPGDTFYQILSGRVEIILSYETEHSIKLTDLGPGNFFGEIAVLENYPRTASAVASSAGVTVLELSENNMAENFRENPDLVLSLMQLLGRRIVSLSEECTATQKALADLESEDAVPVSPSLLDKAKIIADYFFGNRKAKKPSLESTLFAKDGGSIKEGAAGDVFDCDAGTVLFRDGEPGACMYAVHWGTVGIYSGYGTDNEKLLTKLNANDFFGEIGMLCGQPRSATAVALENGTTLEIIRSDSIRPMFERNPAKVWMILDHLARRLTQLTREYAQACRDLCEKAKA